MKALLLGLIRGYQFLFRPLLGANCRFYPSCSAYAEQAIRTRGAVVGSALAVWRVLRCNPFGRGGVEYVPHRSHVAYDEYDASIRPRTEA